MRGVIFQLVIIVYWELFLSNFALDYYSLLSA